MTLSDILSNSYVVTAGGDRLDQFRQMFTAAGLNPDLVHVWRACVLPRAGSMGNAISQYSLVRHALEQDLPFIVIFEDDATPCDTAATELVEAFETRSEGTLCLRLGWNYDPDPDAGEDLSAHRMCYGSQAYALFGREAYETFIEAWEQNGRADIVTSQMPGAKINSKNLFAQHSLPGSIHLTPGWSLDSEMERLVDHEARDRFAKARAIARQRDKEQSIHVAYTIDVQGEGAVPFCNQLLTSVYSLRLSSFANDHIICHVLYANISADLMRQLNRLQTEQFHLDFQPISKKDLDYMQSLSQYPSADKTRTWGGIVFARLWLPLALSDVKRVIYLDTDTVVRKPLRPLWETDLSGNLLGLAHGLVPEFGYNSGVILMDCEAIRKANEDENLYQKLAEHLETYAKTYYLPDQTTINRFFSGRIKELDLAWNYPPVPKKNDMVGLATAAIWHFYSGHKPLRIDADDFGKAYLEWNRILNQAYKEIQ